MQDDDKINFTHSFGNPWVWGVFFFLLLFLFLFVCFLIWFPVNNKFVALWASSADAEHTVVLLQCLAFIHHPDVLGGLVSMWTPPWCLAVRPSVSLARCSDLYFSNIYNVLPEERWGGIKCCPGMKYLKPVTCAWNACWLCTACPAHSTPGEKHVYAAALEFDQLFSLLYSWGKPTP